MDIPERIRYNYINIEALRSYLKDEYNMGEDAIDFICDFVTDSLEEAIDRERGAWLGSLLRERKHLPKS